MATKHVWGNLNKGNNGGSDKFYKLKAEKKNRFRPLGDPVVFYRYYVKNSEGKTLSAKTILLFSLKLIEFIRSAIVTLIQITPYMFSRHKKLL
jgi:hypothetical protein